MIHHPLRASTVLVGLVFATWGCSGSESSQDDDGASGGGAQAGGRSGAGGRVNTGSGSDSAAGGDGADSGGDSGAGGRASGSGGRRGAGGGDPGSDGGDPGSGGGELGSGGTRPGSCEGKNPPPQGQQTTNVDGAERTYYLIPSTTTAAVPLVIDFHGWGGKGEWEVGTFGFNYASEGEAVLMYPDGLQQDWAGGIGWDTRSNDTPDIHFVEQLIADAIEHHCIDESRIFVVGFSWGGWMATQTACALGDRVRAMISIAGGGPGGQCESPVTSMIVHGTNDTSEPISAGIASVASWAEDNDCPGDTASAFDGACEGYSSCAKPLYWCEHPGEHIVPSFIYEIGWSFLMDAP